MEIIVAVLLIIIVYLVATRNTGNNKEEKRSYIMTDTTAVFTKDEWYQAVNDWYESEYHKPYNWHPMGGHFVPWQPPDYEEVKHDIEKLRNLRWMTEENKKPTPIDDDERDQELEDDLEIDSDLPF